MALIACPKCGSTVSEYSETCPCCGHPIRQEREKRRTGRIFLVGAMALTFASAAVSFLIFIPRGAETGKTDATQRPFIGDWQDAPTGAPISIVLPTVPRSGYVSPAAKRAEALLEERAFSYSILSRMLRDEGFGSTDVLYALSQMGVDWNAQAARKARELLENEAYSRDALLEKLEAVGFSSEQAAYGADHCGQALTP